MAILLVICFHFWQTFTVEPHGLVGKLAIWGQTGVDLFFVLSGFLITGILVDLDATNHFLRNFYARRMLRIFPLYYLTLLIFYVALPLLKVIPWTRFSTSLWFWTYLQNVPLTFAPADVVGPSHFWSLAVEEHYYLIWPLLVLWLSRRKLNYVIFYTILFCVAVRIVLSTLGYPTFYLTLCRFDGLAIGSGLALLARREGGLAPFSLPAKIIFIVLALALAIAQLLLSGTQLPALQIAKPTLISLLYGLLLLLILENSLGRRVTGVLSGRVLSRVGLYSYGMYVTHPFLLDALHHFGLPYGIPGLVLSLLITYLAGWASWVLFEKHFLRLKTWFEYSRPQTAQ